MSQRFSKSVRKYIRFEKARIRREVLGTKEQKELILKIYDRFLKQPKVEKLAPVVEEKAEKKAEEKAEEKEAKKVVRKTPKIKKDKINPVK